MTTCSNIPACKIHGQRSLVGYSPWGRKESDTTANKHKGRSPCTFSIHLQSQCTVAKQYRNAKAKGWKYCILCVFKDTSPLEFMPSPLWYKTQPDLFLRKAFTIYIHRNLFFPEVVPRVTAVVPSSLPTPSHQTKFDWICPSVYKLLMRVVTGQKMSFSFPKALILKTFDWWMRQSKHFVH